jgi:hypothetical protein
MPQQIAMGRDIYLHRPDKAFNAEEFHLLISAHGAVLADNIIVPDWANLHFYGRHGAAIVDPGFSEIIEGKYKVIESIAGGERCSNYLLSKYQGRHGSRTETYASLQREVQRNSAFLDEAVRAMADVDQRKSKGHRRVLNTHNFNFHFDVLTIRNRWNTFFGISLNTVLQQLGANGYRYEQIHCSFCRWRPFGGSVSAQEFNS